MKRGLLLSLCAASLVAMTTPAFAQGPTNSDIAISLNLRYTDPANPAAGGEWTLVAKTDTSIGISAIHALINDIDNTNTAFDGTGDIDIRQDIGAINPVMTDNGPVLAVLTDGATKSSLLFGQDISNSAGNPSQVSGIGTPSSVSNVASDPLHNGDWDNASVIATGTFSTATRPTLDAVGNGSTDGNVYTVFDGTGSTSAVAAATSSMFATVRGDSVSIDGLLPGDANRDGIVNGTDLTILGGSWQGAGGWDNGNFNSDASVNGTDLTILGGNWQQSSVPPAFAAATSAVPEPASLVLLLSGLLGMTGIRKR